jgi:hypothetical protein
VIRQQHLPVDFVEVRSRGHRRQRRLWNREQLRA